MLTCKTFRQLLHNPSFHCVFGGGQRWMSNYYDALGITPKATQTEIKAAYYEKSKQCHPDRNQDAESVEKFRQITQAYEVLGNYRLRRLYDKGIIHTAGAEYAHHATAVTEDAVEDDPQTKFYKSRFHKDRVTDPSGRQPIYDFDEWSRAHYGKSFERRKAAKGRFDFKESEKKRHAASVENERVIFGMMLILVVIYFFFYTESSYDVPKSRGNRPPVETKKVD